MLRQVRNNTDPALRESNIYFFYLKLRQRGFPAAMLHRIMMKVNLEERKKARKPDDGKKIIPFIIPFYPSALTRHLKRLLHDFSERPECTYLKIRPVLAFKRTENILQLCGGSAISAAHLQTISGNEDHVPEPEAVPVLPAFRLEDLLDDDD